MGRGYHLMKFFPISFSFFFSFTLASIFSRAKVSERPLSSHEDQTYSHLKSPQFVNTDFGASFMKQKTGVEQYMVDSSQKILKCVTKFYRDCDPGFVQTALFQLEYFAETMVSLKTCSCAIGLIKVGEIRLAVLDLVKDVPMITYYIYPIAYFTLNRTLRVISRRNLPFTKYFSHDSFVIEEIFARFRPSGFDSDIINPEYNYFSIREKLFTYLISHDACLKATLHIHCHDLVRVPSFIFDYFKLLVQNFELMNDAQKHQILMSLFISPLREFQNLFEVMFSNAEITHAFYDTKPVSLNLHDFELVTFSTLMNPRLSYLFIKSRFFILPYYNKSLFKLMNAIDPKNLFDYVSMIVGNDVERILAFLSKKYSHNTKKIDKKFQEIKDFREKFELTHGRSRLSNDKYSNFLRKFSLEDLNGFLIISELCLSNFIKIMRDLTKKYEDINGNQQISEKVMLKANYSNIDISFLKSYFEALLIYRTKGIKIDTFDYFVEDDVYFFDSEKSLFDGKTGTFSISLGSLNLKDVDPKSINGKVINRRLILIIYGAYYSMASRIPIHSPNTIDYDDSKKVILSDSLIGNPATLRYSNQPFIAKALESMSQNQPGFGGFLVRDAFCLYLCLSGVNPKYILKFGGSKERFTKLHFVDADLSVTKEINLKSTLENNSDMTEECSVSLLLLHGIVACGNLLHKTGLSDLDEEDRLVKFVIYVVKLFTYLNKIMINSTSIEENDANSPKVQRFRSFFRSRTFKFFITTVNKVAFQKLTVKCMSQIFDFLPLEWILPEEISNITMERRGRLLTTPKLHPNFSFFLALRSLYWYSSRLDKSSNQALFPRFLRFEKSRWAGLEKVWKRFFTSFF